MLALVRQKKSKAWVSFLDLKLTREWLTATRDSRGRGKQLLSPQVYYGPTYRYFDLGTIFEGDEN